MQPRFYSSVACAAALCRFDARSSSSFTLSLLGIGPGIRPNFPLLLYHFRIHTHIYIYNFGRKRESILPIEEEGKGARSRLPPVFYIPGSGFQKRRVSLEHGFAMLHHHSSRKLNRSRRRVIAAKKREEGRRLSGNKETRGGLL